MWQGRTQKRFLTVTPFMNITFFDIVRCVFRLIPSFGGIFKVFLLKFEVFLGFCTDSEGFFRCFGWSQECFSIFWVDFKSFFFWILVDYKLRLHLLKLYGGTSQNYTVAPFLYVNFFTLRRTNLMVTRATVTTSSGPPLSYGQT